MRIYIILYIVMKSTLRNSVKEVYKKSNNNNNTYGFNKSLINNNNENTSNNIAIFILYFDINNIRKEHFF